jgi:hypothetical protein
MSTYKHIYNAYTYKYLAEKNYYYTPPKDKKTLVNDFLLMNYLHKQGVEDYETGKNKSLGTRGLSDSTVFSYQEIKDEILDIMAEEILNVLFFAISYRFYYVFSNRASHSKQQFIEIGEKDFIKKYAKQFALKMRDFAEFINKDHDELNKENPHDIVKQYRLPLAMLLNSAEGRSREDIVEMLSKAFKEYKKYNKYSDDISPGILLTDKWLQINDNQSEDELFNNITDLMKLRAKEYDLFTPFENYFDYDTRYKWIKYATKKVEDANTPIELMDIVSPSLRPMVAEISKALGKGTVEDYDTYLKNLGFANKSEYDTKRKNYDKYGTSIAKYRDKTYKEFLDMMQQEINMYDQMDFTALSFDEIITHKTEIRTYISLLSQGNDYNFLPTRMIKQLKMLETEINEVLVVARKKRREELLKTNVWEGGNYQEQVWEGGLWKGGTFQGHTWVDGVWEDGTFMGNIWKDGIWKGGTWVKGLNDGVWKDGTWEDGIWENGTWEKGTWEKGLWRDGWFRGGTWKEGIWKSGYFDGGIWENGTWYTGTWYDGEWKRGYIHDGKKLVYSEVNPSEFQKKNNNSNSGYEEF